MSVATSARPTEGGLAQTVLQRSIDSATDALLKQQKPDGHWVFELEADATIPAEYVLLRALSRRDAGSRTRAQDRRLPAPHPRRARRLAAVSCRRIQHLGASVKAYFALKMIGDDIDAPHMERAREAILAHGGAAQCNVFTRKLLALYGQMPWRGVPVMPVEIMRLPRWFPFHIAKISYWARTVLVPLTVLNALQVRAPRTRKASASRNCSRPRRTELAAGLKGRTRSGLGRRFSAALIACCSVVEPLLPARQRASAPSSKRRHLRHRAVERRATVSARSSRRWRTR